MDGLFLLNMLDPEHHRSNQKWTHSHNNHGALHPVPGVHSRWRYNLGALYLAVGLTADRQVIDSIFSLSLYHIVPGVNRVSDPIFLSCWSGRLLASHGFRMEKHLSNWIWTKQYYYQRATGHEQLQTFANNDPHVLLVLTHEVLVVLESPFHLNCRSPYQLVACAAHVLDNDSLLRITRLYMTRYNWIFLDQNPDLLTATVKLICAQCNSFVINSACTCYILRSVLVLHLILQLSFSCQMWFCNCASPCLFFSPLVHLCPRCSTNFLLMPASSLVYLQSQSGISGTHFIPFFDLRFSVVHYFRSYCLDHELFLVVPADAVYTVHDCLVFLPLLICPPVTMDASPLRPAPPHAFPWPPSRRRAATAIVNTTDGDASPLRARGSTISHHLYTQAEHL